MARGGIIGGGIVLLIISIIGYNIPLGTTAADPNTALTIPVAAGICNSAMGQLGQAFSGEAVKLCSEWNIMLNGIYGSGILGLILIIVGSVVSGGQKEVHHEREVEDDALDILEKRYAKGEISKDEFDKMKKDLE